MSTLCIILLYTILCAIIDSKTLGVECNTITIYEDVLDLWPFLSFQYLIHIILDEWKVCTNTHGVYDQWVTKFYTNFPLVPNI